MKTVALILSSLFLSGCSLTIHPDRSKEVIVDGSEFAYSLIQILNDK